MQCASRSSGRSSSQRGAEGPCRWHRSPDSSCSYPFKPRLCQVSSPFLGPLTLPPGPSSPLPMLIYNLQPPRPKSFFLTLHCPVVASDPIPSLASWMKETGKGERPLENNGSHLSLVHLVPYFPSKKEISFEHLGTSKNSVLVELLEN